MTPDQLAALVATLASCMEPVVDVPVFWIAVQVLLAVLVLVVCGVLAVWAAEIAEERKRHES